MEKTLLSVLFFLVLLSSSVRAQTGDCACNVDNAVLQDLSVQPVPSSTLQEALNVAQTECANSAVPGQTGFIATFNATTFDYTCGELPTPTCDVGEYYNGNACVEIPEDDTCKEECESAVP